MGGWEGVPRLRRSREVLVERLATAVDPIIKSDLHRLIEQANQDIIDITNRITTLEKLGR